MEDIGLFEDMITRILETEIEPHYEDWEKAKLVPRELWNRLGEAGLLAIDLPEEYGGAGAPTEVSLFTIYEMARQCFGGFASSYNIHSNIVMPYVLNLGTDAQKAHWLPKMASGDVVTAIAMTEPGAGSDLAGMKTRAVRDGDDWVINGSKTFITNGIHADMVIVCAKTDSSRGSKGISLFMVDASLPGFDKGKSIEKIGQHASDTAELFFHDVRVPADALLGEENSGFVHLMDELPRERLGCVALAIGSMEGALEQTTNYVLERKAFGKRIADFQNTRFKIGDMKAKLELNRAFYEKCLGKFNRNEMTVEDAAQVKLAATEAQLEVVNECLQLFGGYGYTSEYKISRFYCDARVQTIYAGSSEIMKEICARPLLGR